MGEIDKIRIGETEYDIEDERIASGTLGVNESITFDAGMVLFAGSCDANFCVYFISQTTSEQIAGSFTVEISAMTVTNSSGSEIEYIALKR